LLLQRFAQFVQQPRILDGDDSLTRSRPSKTLSRMRNAAERSFWTFADHQPDLGIGNAEQHTVAAGLTEKIAGKNRRTLSHEEICL
jgi:hypothetical protein